MCVLLLRLRVPASCLELGGGNTLARWLLVVMQAMNWLLAGCCGGCGLWLLLFKEEKTRLRLDHHAVENLTDFSDCEVVVADGSGR